MVTVHKTKEAARQQLKPGGALYAADICEGGPKCFYAAATSMNFVNYFLKLRAHEQMHYEIIPDGVPIKLYFDVEYLYAENVGLQMDAVVELINSAVQTVLGLPDLKPFQTDASNAKKASRHLAYPVVLPSKAHVKNLVDQVLANLRQSGTAPVTSEKGQVCGIDESVYDTERNFRLCYAHKFGQPERKFQPVGLVSSQLDALQRSMISHFLEGLPLVFWTFRTISTVDKVSSSAKRTMHVEPRPIADLEPGDHAKLSKIREYAIEKWPETKIAGQKRHKNMLQITLNPGVFCPNAKRAHANNSTWFNVELPDGKGHLHCADPDCKEAARWGRFWVEL